LIAGFFFIADIKRRRKAGQVRECRKSLCGWFFGNSD
jgi:hypothetical protein